MFFFSGLRDAKKGGPGARSKLDLFFCAFRALPGGPQEGSRLHGSSIFTFTAGAKKGSKMRAKMELFGLPNPHYTHFGAPFGRNGCPKRGVKKSCNFEQKASALWGGAGGRGRGQEKKNSSKECRKGMLRL